MPDMEKRIKIPIDANTAPLDQKVDESIKKNNNKKATVKVDADTNALISEMSNATKAIQSMVQKIQSSFKEGLDFKEIQKDTKDVSKSLKDLNDKSDFSGIKQSLSDILDMFNNLEDRIQKVTSTSSKTGLSSIRVAVSNMEKLNTAADTFVNNLDRLAPNDYSVQFEKLIDVFKELKEIVYSIQNGLNLDNLRPSKTVISELESVQEKLKSTQKIEREINKLETSLGGRTSITNAKDLFNTSGFIDTEAIDKLIQKMKRYVELGGDLSKFSFKTNDGTHNLQEIYNALSNVNKASGNLVDNIKVYNSKYKFEPVDINSITQSVEAIKKLRNEEEELNNELERAKQREDRDLRVSLDTSSLEKIEQAVAKINQTINISGENGVQFGLSSNDLNSILDKLESIVIAVNAITTALQNGVNVTNIEKVGSVLGQTSETVQKVNDEINEDTTNGVSKVEHLEDKIEDVSNILNSKNSVTIFDGIKETVYDTEKDLDSLMQKLDEMAEKMMMPVFHGGVLSKETLGSDNYRPGESLRNQLEQHKGGAVGTGTYFTSDLEDVLGWIKTHTADEKHSNLYAVDLSKYLSNLYTPSGDNEIDTLTDFFRNLSQFANSSSSFDETGASKNALEKSIKGEATIENFYNYYKELFGKLGVDFDGFEKWFNNEVTRLKSFERSEESYKRAEKADNTATTFQKHFLKNNGINVNNGLYDDSTGVGSVVFDIDKNHPYDIDFGNNQDIAKIFFNKVFEKILKNKASNPEYYMEDIINKYHLNDDVKIDDENLRLDYGLSKEETEALVGRLKEIRENAVTTKDALESVAKNKQELSSTHSSVSAETAIASSSEKKDVITQEINGSSQTTSSLIQEEQSKLGDLSSYIRETVIPAIEEKTQAFTQEKIGVETAVDFELQKLQELYKKLLDIEQAAKNISLNPIEMQILQVGDAGADISTMPTTVQKPDSSFSINEVKEATQEVEKYEIALDETIQKENQHQSSSNGFDIVKKEIKDAKVLMDEYIASMNELYSLRIKQINGDTSDETEMAKQEAYSRMLSLLEEINLLEKTGVDFSKEKSVISERLLELRKELLNAMSSENKSQSESVSDSKKLLETTGLIASNKEKSVEYTKQETEELQKQLSLEDHQSMPIGSTSDVNKNTSSKEQWYETEKGLSNFQQDIDNLSKGLKNAIKDPDFIEDFIKKIIELKEKWSELSSAINDGKIKDNGQFDNIQEVLDSLSQKLFKDTFSQFSTERMSPQFIQDLSTCKEDFVELQKIITSINSKDIIGDDQINQVKKLIASLSDLLERKKSGSEKTGNPISVQTILTNIAKDLKNTAMTKELKNQFIELQVEAKTMWETMGRNIPDEQVKEFALRWKELHAVMVETGQEGKSFFDMIKEKSKGLSAFSLARYFSLYDVIRYIREAVQIITQLDTAMVELRKVTNGTSEEYNKFGEVINGYTKEVASTHAELISSAADWARLGYSIQEAADLSKSSAMFVNVGDGIDINEATEDMISAMKAFDIEAEDSMRIVDAYNEVGNNFAISAGGIGEAMQRSASALATGNNTFEQSIALITAMNEVIQDTETTGTTLKVLSLRLRGAKTEIEAVGESTDGMAESTSKLQAKIKALTNTDGKGGFDIMTDTGDFKSTYEIIKGIAEKWQDISDVNQANIVA